MTPRHLILAALPAAFASIAAAQSCQVVVDPKIEVYPSPALTYPLTSDRYAVEYKSGEGDWTDVRVYITAYGGTTSSPYHTYSSYPPNITSSPGHTQYITSMSFVSIPTNTGADVALRVTKRWGSPFPSNDRLSVRPRVKGIHVERVSDFTVEVSTKTADDFAGEQFILWWDGDARQSSAIQGLAFFLDPPYDRPTGANVKTITPTSQGDLYGDLSKYDTLVFDGTIVLGTAGALAYVVPANIDNVFLAPKSWVQGKLRFEQSGAGHVKRLYGPGVLDASRFDYSKRHCRATDDGYPSISWVAFPATTTRPSLPDRFVLDGIITTDGNFFATDKIVNGVVNNVKVMSWNGNNDGLEFGLSTAASNVFVRASDDSLKMWDSYITVTNATVWQNFNGGVVNLGWSDKNAGDGGRIDGLYVVRTDWHNPAIPSWDADTLNGQLNSQNNAVIASMMTPGTHFGAMVPSVYRNIYVEDTPWVLFSLKILPVDCGLGGLAGQTCPIGDLSLPSVLNLNIEHLFTPPSMVENSIGFQNVKDPPLFTGTLTGTINIGLTDVNIVQPNGKATTLTSENALGVGNIHTNGDNVNIAYEEEDKPSQQWFSAWSASQWYPISSASKNGSIVRMIVRPTISGAAVRVRIENTAGRFPVAFSAAYIGKSQSGAALEPGSNTQLTFGGRTGLTLAAGEGAFSDPVPFKVEAFARYAVSLDVAAASDISSHYLGLVTNYSADSAAAAFTPVPPLGDSSKGPAFPIYWVAALDVESTSNTGTVVALGDSITDGQCSTRDSSSIVQPDQYNRWTDVLAARFAEAPAEQSKAVANEGIAGNTVVSGGAGFPALLRMNSDVLVREGVTHLILFEGTNDLGNHATAQSVIAGDQQIINRARAAGLKIIGATIIPRGGERAWTKDMEPQRLELNEWIRHRANFDGVIDFDELMEGPVNSANNSVTLPSKWSCSDGDGVHPNSAGYAAMGAAIDLSLFSKHEDH